MAIVVRLNQRVSNPRLGVIQQDNAQFWDPLTKTNLTRSNPTSGDLTAFSAAQLQNVATAVQNGVLTLVSGTMPSTNAIYAAYGLFASAGQVGGPGWTGVTGLAAGTF